MQAVAEFSEADKTDKSQWKLTSGCIHSSNLTSIPTADEMCKDVGDGEIKKHVSAAKIFCFSATWLSGPKFYRI